MSCPDRNNDKRIIAEIERRKALKNIKVQNESFYEFLEFPVTTTLNEISSHIEEDRIKQILRTETGWLVIFTIENKV